MILTFPHVGSTPWEFDWFRKRRSVALPQSFIDALPILPRTPIVAGAGTVENGT